MFRKFLIIANKVAFTVLIGLALLCGVRAMANDGLNEMETMLEMFDEGEEVMTRCPAGALMCEPDESLVKREPIDKAPAPFRESNIKRKLKDGTTQEFDGDKYKIVRRTKKTKKKAKPQRPIVIEQVTNVHFKNRLGVMVGYGNLGNLKEGVDANGNTSFGTDQGMVLGLEYNRDFWVREDYSIYLGLQGQTNKTFSVKGGIGF